MEGIGVAAFDDRVGLGGKLCHSISRSVAATAYEGSRPGGSAAGPPVRRLVFELVEAPFPAGRSRSAAAPPRGRPATAARRSWSRDSRRGRLSTERSRHSPSRGQSALLVGRDLERALQRCAAAAHRWNGSGRRRRAPPASCAGAAPACGAASPSKSVMKTSSLTISTWPRCEIAVMTDGHETEVARRQAVQNVGQRRAFCAANWSTRGRSVSLTDVANEFQDVERAVGAVDDLAAPALPVGLAGIGSGVKSGPVASAGQRQMQLGEPPPDLRHLPQMRRLLLAFAVLQQALLLDKAVEIARRHRPGIALVLDLGMQRCDRAAAAVGLDQFGACRAGQAYWRNPRPRSGNGRSRWPGWMPASSLRNSLKAKV